MLEPLQRSADNHISYIQDALRTFPVASVQRNAAEDIIEFLSRYAELPPQLLHERLNARHGKLIALRSLHHQKEFEAFLVKRLIPFGEFLWFRHTSQLADLEFDLRFRGTTSTQRKAQQIYPMKGLLLWRHDRHYMSLSRNTIPKGFPSMRLVGRTAYMKKVQSPVWTHASIPTADLILDDQNPRIVVRSNAKPDEIRKSLIETEEVDDLATKIVKTDGNMAGERIIVLADKNGRYRVLEGNRRACACQLLLDPSLIPEPHKTKFPAITPATRTAIKELAADIAPSREAAEPIITRRHTEAGIKQWNTVAKHRRIRRLLAAGRSLQSISAEFDQSLPGLRKLMREMALLDRVQSLPGWNQKEKTALADAQLKTNPFTRFFSLQGVRPALALKFEEDGSFKSDLQDKDLNSVLHFIARKFLIPNANGEPEANTRTTPAEIWKQFAAMDKRTAKKLKVSASVLAGKAKKKLRGKSASFFQSLECPIKHDQLRQITKEISTTDYVDFPLSATYLVRALIEQSLDHAITKAGLDNLLHKDWHTPNRRPQKDPGLDFTISFAIKHADEIFNGGVTKILQHWQKTKRFADMIIHGKWATAHPTTLEQFASFVRPLIQKILNESALK